MLRPITPRYATHESQLTLILASPLQNAGDLLQRLRTLGLRSIATCRLTRNRNVMVSFAAGELRVHEGYLAAPDDVIAAIVHFVEGRTRAERLRARRRLLDFPIETGAMRRHRRDTTHPDDRPLAERLTEYH